MPIATQAQPVGNPKLLITEIDSTHLTVTDGIGNPVGMVNFLGPDSWFWDSGVSTTLEDPGFFGAGLSWSENNRPGLWAEPAPDLGRNFATLDLGKHFGLIVGSDDASFPSFVGNANGTYGGTLTAETFRDFGESNVVTTVAFKYDVYFNDLGDVASGVPDNSSTLGMMALLVTAICALGRFRTAKPRSAALSVFLFGTATLGLQAQTTNGPPPSSNHQLVFTEESPTLLTATLDGNPYGTVVNTGVDHWHWTSPTFSFTLADGITMAGPNTLAWHEPGGESGLNTSILPLFDPVFDQNGALVSVTLRWDFISDYTGPFPGYPIPPQFLHPPAQNGAIGGTIAITQPGNNSLLDLTDISFVDRDDISAVPDASSTLGMLLLSVCGLVSGARLSYFKRQTGA